MKFLFPHLGYLIEVWVGGPVVRAPDTGYVCKRTYLGVYVTYLAAAWCAQAQALP